MKRLVLQCWFLLWYFELVMLVHDFKTLHMCVARERLRREHNQRAITTETLSHAMDLACVFYFKQVLCLQRSAATTLLLRRYGFPAEMILGAQMLPFKSHAWVEVGEIVVNDKPYMREMYQVLERC